MFVQIRPKYVQATNPASGTAHAQQTRLFISTQSIPIQAKFYATLNKP